MKTIDNLPALHRAMDEMQRSRVLVGIPSDSSDNARSDAFETNAEIGLINEFGEPAKNIPARPSLVPGVSQAWGKIHKRMALHASKMLQLHGNERGEVEKALNGAGLVAVASVVGMIDAGLNPELAPMTISLRQAAGIKGTKPLIATGAYKQSITYVIKNA